jgi:hypothetical protein
MPPLSGSIFSSAHLSCKISPNGSELANDPRVDRDAIHSIKPNSVPRDEGHYTFGSTCIVLQVSIFQTLQNNLASIDFSVLLIGVMTIADEIDSQLSQAMARLY